MDGQNPQAMHKALGLCPQSQETGGEVIIAGIDPGKGGAICLLDEGGWIIRLEICPTVKIKKKREYDIRAMCDLLSGVNVAWLEKVHSMPGQGVASMFSFGRGFGIWEGLIIARSISLQYVPPQTWKKKMLHGLPKDKNSAILRTKDLYPKPINLKPTERSRKDSVALAEAYLIATYGWNWGSGDSLN